MFAGAALSQAVWDKLHAHAEASVGERVRVITGLGMTETAPSCTFAVGTDVASGHIGLPVPGVEVKLVQDASTGDKTEIRFRGPNVMPGYWRLPAQTAEAFDDEGFYRTGDAARWVDPAQPQRGLFFDGRTAEDFKLSSGTFVSVGPLRAKIKATPCAGRRITGLNHGQVGALLLSAPTNRLACCPRPHHCRVLHHPAVPSSTADRLWREATSASRVTRLHVLAEPPSTTRACHREDQPGAVLHTATPWSGPVRRCLVRPLQSSNQLRRQHDEHPGSIGFVTGVVGSGEAVARELTSMGARTVPTAMPKARSM
jgi:feruloyl-CoA synthase